MPRPTKGPHLDGGARHERHLLVNLTTQLIAHESIRTTEIRTRRLRPYVEKLITKDKRDDLHARCTILKKVTDKYVVYRPFGELASKFEGREGGYICITKMTLRKGGNAPMAIISLVLEPAAYKKIVGDAVATVRKTVQKAIADEDRAEKKVTTEKAEKVGKADKADKAEYADTAHLEGGATDIPDDGHPVKGNEDPMKYHVSGPY